MKKLKNILYLWACACLLVLATQEATAQNKRRRIPRSYQRILDKSERAYEQGDYAQAMELYEDYVAKLKRRRIKPSEGEEGFAQRVERMLTALEHQAELVLIDSLRFPKAQLAEVIAQQNPRLARLLSFRVDSLSFSISYNNSLRGFSILPRQGGQARNLFRVDTLLNQEVVEAELSENINTLDDEANPFVLSGGYTLIFARNGAETLGGYDLYYANYNAEKKTYFKANALPIPLNSRANDYLFAYDDETHSSYLISDRACSSDSLALFRYEGLPKMIDDGSSEHRIQGAGAILSQGKNAKSMPALPLKEGVVLRVWADFSSAEAMSLYKDYLQLVATSQQKTAHYKELSRRYKRGEENLAPEIEELNAELELLHHKAKKQLKACKNEEIKQRKL